MATIDQVAALAGVSIKSVSRVLNNEPYVSAKLRAKVLEAIEELDYSPSQAARQMAGGRSHIIVTFYSDLRPAYIMSMCSGAGAECRRQGWHLVLEPLSRENKNIDEMISRVVRTLRPDGFFVAPPICDDPVFISAVEKANIPLVRIAPGVIGKGMDIPVDDRQPAFEMTQYLISLGHRRIGFVSADIAHKSAMDRLDGYREALAAAGIECDSNLIAKGNMRFESGKIAGSSLLSLDDRPTAIFASTDDMALGVMYAAREMGLSLPDDLSVCGFDDIPSAEKSWPALTTIRQPISALGEAAVKAIINGKTESNSRFPCELIIRNSTMKLKK